MMDNRLRIRQLPTSLDDRKNQRLIRNHIRNERRNKNLDATTLSQPLGKKIDIPSNYKNINAASFQIDDKDLGVVNLGAVLREPARDLKQATPAGCRAYVDHCVPVDMHLIPVGPTQKDTVVEQDWNLDPPGGSEISLSAALEDYTKWWVFFEQADYYWLYFLYEYDIPAPTCDALIAWSGNIKLSCERLIEDADFFVAALRPIALSSTAGSLPSWIEIQYGMVLDHPSSVYLRHEDGETDVLASGSNDYHSISQSYDVPAGVASKVYLGFGLDLRCKDGKIKAQALLDIAPPPSQPDKSISFVSWAKEITVNCYITSAICKFLGKGDDCRELGLLREFRDNYLAKRPGGEEMIQEYYRRSPVLLRAIEEHPSGGEILFNLYEKYLSRCIELIECGANEAAVEIYQNMVYHLESAVAEAGR
jgi:hypothetical protein